MAQLDELKLLERWFSIVTNSCLVRVTISGKAKIGTLDGDFSRDQIYGLIQIFF